VGPQLPLFVGPAPKGGACTAIPGPCALLHGINLA